jgi:hypothetical protein
MKHHPEKTAISRTKPAKPMRLLDEKGLLKGSKLDYGCGKGLDAETFNMEKFDPFYHPEKPNDSSFDTITCQYVLNVLPKDEETKILKDIQNLLKNTGKAYITVRRDISKEGLTSKKTFQRNVVLSLPVLHEEKNAFCIYELSKTSKIKE